MNSPVLESNNSANVRANLSENGQRLLVSPLAKRLAKDAGINLNLIKVATVALCVCYNLKISIFPHKFPIILTIFNCKNIRIAIFYFH